MGSNRGHGTDTDGKRRASTRAFIALALAALAFAATLVDHRRLGAERRAALAEGRAFAARMQITDLALFSEARYTRHLTQADRHAAFQDHPMAMEHFPAGSLALSAEVPR